MTTYPTTRPTAPSNLLGAFADPRSYANIAYLLLAFPLGVAYFVALVAGFALGAGLAITLVGIPILLATLLAARALGRFEGALAESLLGETIPSAAVIPAGESIWGRIKAGLTDGFTWKSVLFLFLKFPAGIASFVITVTLGALVAALLAAPLSYHWSGTQMNLWDRSIDTLPEALLCFVAGLVLAPIALWLVNGLAALSGLLARALLSER
jgi:hypothetical protein